MVWVRQSEEKELLAALVESLPVCRVGACFSLMNVMSKATACENGQVQFGSNTHSFNSMLMYETNPIAGTEKTFNENI